MKAKSKAAATPEPLTMTVDEAAQKLGISRNTAYACARSGQLPVIRLGKRMLVPRVAFEAMVRGEGTSSAKAA
ncbi:helix-turn-helix domain-containing protein [Reyranella sp.]|uniref:helix-turn-helix domain-containing protein n=1 Tax=Reyranella sp. TaxID=1929291 RepID=UPI0026121069|nr:helix-turn-helix domain-containing protein [Reyranella sp.]HQS15449.1 helix-turn-helix domain-containing protein [Reyranella sp.]HQT11975.1 helix-turn-helix domain-containing protein [Reyranella sp.]